jgi:N-acetylmuramoyl-L-alanine amidase
MSAVNTEVIVFSRLRLALTLVFLVGFWVCSSQIKLPEKWFSAFRSSDPFSSGGIQSTSPLPSLGDGPVGADAASEGTIEPTLVLDAGHGGNDGGTAGNGLVEKDWTLKLVLALAEELQNRGHKVTLTRDSDLSLSLKERAQLCNSSPRTALLSIHFNAGSPDASGIETWYSWPKKPEIMARMHSHLGLPIESTLPDEGQRLAHCMQSALNTATGARDRGYKNRTDLAITSSTLCPSVLIECGFLSNGTEKRKIQDASYRKKLVEGIANGYEEWRNNQSGDLILRTGTESTSPTENISIVGH